MKFDINKKLAERINRRHRKMAGISIIEVIIVLVIIAVLTAISIPYIYYSKRLYKPEDQALKVMDLMREAEQLALFKHRTFRLEVDLTDNRILIIDGKSTTAGVSDDVEIKSIPLESVGDVRMDVIPTGVTPPNPPNYDNAVFATDTAGHLRGTTTINGNRVWQIFFLSDGSVVKANGSPVSANLYFWTPLTPGSVSDTTPRSKQEVRAITIFGGSGAVRYWKHTGTAFKSY